MKKELTVFSSQNLNTLRKSGYVQVIYPVDTVLAIISVSSSKDGDSYKLTTYLKDLESNKRLKGTKTITVPDIEFLDLYASSSIRALLDNKKSILNVKECSASKSSVINDNGSVKDLKERILSIPELLDPVVYPPIKTGTRLYSKTTIQDAVNYLAHTLSKMYLFFGSLSLSEEQQLEYFNKLVDKNCKGNKSNREQVQNNISQKWYYAELVRQCCNKIAPDKGPWPVNPIPVPEHFTISSNELLKIIPLECYYIALRLIVRCCEAGVQEAFAGCGEAFCGARVGESAALKLSGFEFLSSSECRYYIETQVGKDSIITDLLKNIYSYRFISIPVPMQYVYQLRFCALKSAGLSDEEIGLSLLGSDYSDSKKPLPKAKVSSFLKEILVLSGVERDSLDKLSGNVMGSVGEDSDHDVCAHLFRKIYATLLANGGMKPYEVDSLLGHENKANIHRDFADVNTSKKIFKKVERAIWLNRIAPCSTSINPAYSPVPVSSPSRYILDGNKSYKFKLVEDCLISAAHFISLESVSPLKICISNPDRQIHINSPSASFETDSYDKMVSRPILPNNPSYAEIEKWIAVANSIDITGIIEKYKGD